MRLIVEVGSAEREFVIDRAEAVIGRGSECDVVLAEHGVSRQHARLQSGPGEAVSDGRLAGSTWYAVDLGTTNGTFVNGRRLQAHRPETLKAGDRISIGSAVLVVRDLEPPRSGQAPGALMGLHPAMRAAAALLFIVALVAIVALLVIVLRPEPRAEEAVLPTAASPIDVLTTVLPSGVPADVLEPLEEVLPGLPLFGTREP